MRALGWRSAVIVTGAALLASGQVASGAIVFPTTQPENPASIEHHTASWELRTASAEAQPPTVPQREMIHEQGSMIDAESLVPVGKAEAEPIIEPMRSRDERVPTIPLSAIDSVYLNVSAPPPMLAVPEPSALTLVGVAGALLLRRRR